MPTNEQHDERKVKHIVQDEVAPDTRRGRDGVGAVREEVTDVAGLQDEEGDPKGKTIVSYEKRAYSLRGLPEDIGDDCVQGEAGRVQCICVPYPVTDVVPIAGFGRDVVDRRDDRQQPAGNGQDLVRDNGARVVGLALGERVDCSRSGQLSTRRRNWELFGRR